MSKKMKVSEAQKAALKKLDGMKISVSKSKAKREKAKQKEKLRKKAAKAEWEEHKKGKSLCVFSAGKTVSGGAFNKR